MSSEESLEARQNNEFEAIQSIYETNLIDLRKQLPWNQWAPLNLSLTLFPQKGNSGIHENHVQVDLHVKCPKNYPNVIPNIKLENGKGLSNAVLTELQEELTQEATLLIGEEMIFQLAQYVEQFLHKHNKPSSKSFYEEMLQRQKEQEEKENEAKTIEQNRQRQYFIEEVQKRQEILKTESKLRRDSRYSIDNLSDDGFDGNKHSSLNSDESICLHQHTSTINFDAREIQRGKCLKHSTPNHVIFSGIDKESGEMVQISEWSISIKNKNDISVIERQISGIEQELGYLVRLKHPNIAQYQNIKHELFAEENKFVLHVVQEFIFGSSCNTLFTRQNIKVNVDLLKYIAKGVLCAIDYLHRNNVVHRNLSDTCVYLSSKGVKLSKYSIQKRISDLIAQSHTTYGKKTDIYDYGLFLITLLKGSKIEDENFDIPNSIPSDLYDLLQRCLAKEEKERFTTTQLLNHSFFRKAVVHFPPNHRLEEIVQENNAPEIVNYEISPPQSNGQSRINNEFEFLQHLGKGAFGDVIKVRNKLDGGNYAIKRIKLNPKNKQLNKKIVREVKLLSRLNHENVVRYYNSWIETTTIKSDDTDSSENTFSEKLDFNVPRIVKKDEFTINDNIEDLAPPIKNVEVSVTYDSKSQRVFDSSDDESSDDEGIWAAYDNSDSDGIEFEHNSSESPSKISSCSSQNVIATDPTEENVTQIDFMYIQMEFCEKSTLRHAIDDDLYVDEDRVRRLFREIVEGLAHIHQQGMIHRDLKPVNIFLDSEDHVKIGDFGLATTDIKSRQNEHFTAKSPIESDRDRDNTADESKTGAVGTALYVAPEISLASKAIYNQKVDIYSLGVILFEMCFKPLDTSMERIKILTGLRSKEITFPEEFLKKKNEKQETLIKLLLTHDITKRPTSLELLQSDYIPPPVLEERELRELVRHTLSNPQLKGYKYLIASCFQQSVTPAQDITYDKDPTSSHNSKPFQIYDFVRQACVKIFKQHGGHNLATPLLMPKSKYYENLDLCVKLMTHFGSIVTLPHDLRVPFARYIAWNGIQQFRRYSIERVYRERKVFGFLPRELYECAFDIVSPTSGNLMSDGEILYLVYEIINEISCLKNTFKIRLNHTSLLKAILLHCGVRDNHAEVFNVLSGIKESKISKTQMQDYLITLGLSDNSISLFINLTNQEFDISKITNQFQMILKKKSGEASQLAKQAIQDLKQIAQNAEAFGVTFDIIISPGLFYNIQQYSGMICQFVCEIKKKHKHSLEVLAAGGRYDSMIATHRNIMLQANMLDKDVHQSAVGVSISLDKLVQAIQRESGDEVTVPDHLDVAVCSIGTKPMLKEKAKILKSLWAGGIRCFLIESTNLEEIHEEVNELKVPHIVILKDNEQGVVLLQSWERDRLQESIIATSKLVKELQQTLKVWQDKGHENNQCVPICRSESKVSYSESLQEPTVDVLFVTEEKLSSNARKRYDNQIRSHLENLFTKLTGYIVVIGLSFDANVIRTLASFLEFDSEPRFQDSVTAVIEKHQRHKRFLSEVCDELYKHRAKRTNPSIVLFSITDYFYKVIV
ncbi:unnamed protein product [Brassicogethes aeneus]|uniref:non-specific serine/threonine protein kinase n=1 Tax=Brassicogethes aeneus TaxID=1431903 RepID=A0A9P0AZM7_BRAAE|nr:unnamed protein product [Brassicogethes aeneus]